jgi:putative Holliday junction resolvase
MRFLGVDWGSKRVGLAIADHDTFAVPLRTIERRPNIMETIRKEIEAEEVDEIVMGLPINMDGTEGPAALRVRQAAKDLSSHCQKPVHLWDERLSSFEAEQRLLDAGAGPKKSRAVVDQLAAAVILQSFLDARAT